MSNTNSGARSDDEELRALKEAAMGIARRSTSTGTPGTATNENSIEDDNNSKMPAASTGIPGASSTTNTNSNDDDEKLRAMKQAANPGGGAGATSVAASMKYRLPPTRGRTENPNAAGAVAVTPSTVGGEQDKTQIKANMGSVAARSSRLASRRASAEKKKGDDDDGDDEHEEKEEEKEEDSPPPPQIGAVAVSNSQRDPASIKAGAGSVAAARSSRLRSRRASNGNDEENEDEDSQEKHQAPQVGAVAVSGVSAERDPASIKAGAGSVAAARSTRLRSRRTAKAGEQDEEDDTTNQDNSQPQIGAVAVSGIGPERDLAALKAGSGLASVTERSARRAQQRSQRASSAALDADSNDDEEEDDDGAQEAAVTTAVVAPAATVSVASTPGALRSTASHDLSHLKAQQTAAVSATPASTEIVPPPPRVGAVASSSSEDLAQMKGENQALTRRSTSRAAARANPSSSGTMTSGAYQTPSSRDVAQWKGEQTATTRRESHFNQRSSELTAANPDDDPAAVDVDCQTQERAARKIHSATNTSASRKKLRDEKEAAMVAGGSVDSSSADEDESNEYWDDDLVDKKNEDDNGDRERGAHAVGATDLDDAAVIEKQKKALENIKYDAYEDEDGQVVLNAPVEAFVFDEEEEEARKQARYEELLKQKEDETRDEFMKDAIEAINVVVDDGTLNKTRPRRPNWFLRGLCLIVLVMVVLVIALVPNYGGDEAPPPGPTREEALIDLVEPISGQDILNETLHRGEAFQWLLHNDTLQYDPRYMNPVLVKERYVIALFYFAMSGHQWTDQLNFLSNTSVCEWNENGDLNNNGTVLRNYDYIGCDAGNVATININLNNLYGTIPPELGELFYLKTFSVAENTVFGTIPPSLGRLRRMERFQANLNKISGPIPDALSNWTRLEFFNLFRNRVTGTIPPAMFQFQEMEYFNVILNRLTGTLPAFNRNPRWEFLGVADNNFWGPIPPSATQLGSLQAFVVRFNSLTGPIPIMDNMKWLTAFDARYNLFTGTLPSELGLLERVFYFDVVGNILTGTLPSEMGSLFDLRFLFLSRNFLTGTIPSEYSQMYNLDQLSLYTNEFSGEIPSFLITIPGIQQLDFGANNFTGNIDETICRNLDAAPSLANLVADCLGDDPEVTCSCCTKCCGNVIPGCVPSMFVDCVYCEDNPLAVCSRWKFFLEDVGADRNAECTCSEDGRTVSCIDKGCQYCTPNWEADGCYVDDEFTRVRLGISNEGVAVQHSLGPGYGFTISEAGNPQHFFMGTRFVRGFSNETVFFLQTAGTACEVLINGESCNACTLSFCGGDLWQTYLFDCNNIPGYGLVDGCKSTEDNPLVQMMPTYDIIGQLRSFERYDCEMRN